MGFCCKAVLLGIGFLAGSGLMSGDRTGVCRMRRKTTKDL